MIFHELFVLMSPDMHYLRKESDYWCLVMFLAACTSFVTCFTQKFSFGVVGENITMHMRRNLYEAIIKKSVGWFD
jgi:ATP-binding cassette subfamily B (MDR/TAP) protein 1